MAAEMSTSPVLLALPQEIYLCLFVFLDWPSVKTFRLTCRTLASLLPPQQLQSQFRLCVESLYDEERKTRQRMDAEYWEAAEQAFLGVGYHGYSSSHDPDLDAIQKRLSCSYDRLPCYFCLQWLPSSTSEDKFARTSHFSRTRSTLVFDLGGKRARERNCISCGLKRGMYQRGTILKHSVVCINCGNLAEPIPNWMGFWTFDSRGRGRDYFCKSCFEDESVAKMTDRQYWHERHHAKYDVALRRGKAYRSEKGRMLREDKGIVGNPQEETSEPNERNGEDSPNPVTGRDRHGRPPSRYRGPNAGYCPIMDEMRFCICGGWNPPWLRNLRPGRSRTASSRIRDDPSLQ